MSAGSTSQPRRSLRDWLSQLAATLAGAVAVTAQLSLSVLPVWTAAVAGLLIGLTLGPRLVAASLPPLGLAALLALGGLPGGGHGALTALLWLGWTLLLCAGILAGALTRARLTRR